MVFLEEDMEHISLPIHRGERFSFLAPSAVIISIAIWIHPTQAMMNFRATCPKSVESLDLNCGICTTTGAKETAPCCDGIRIYLCPCVWSPPSSLTMPDVMSLLIICSVWPELKRPTSDVSSLIRPQPTAVVRSAVLKQRSRSGAG